MTGLVFALTVFVVAAALSIIMCVSWAVWLRTRNSGWIDATWTFGLGGTGAVGALAPALLSGSVMLRQIVVAAFIGVWSLRLGLHIVRRTARITDDPRYAKLVREWGAEASLQMLLLVQKQALVSVPLALSVLLAAWNPAPGLRLQDLLAVFVLVVAIVGEAVADAQLRRFRAIPANRGHVCDIGLWAWSRHPNYFFEWLGWVAYPLFAIDFGSSYPWGWIAVAGPACMYWLLVHVSGIPPLEEHMLERRHDEFRAYQARTSAFFPAPPRTIGANSQ
jgi:steroid 5-alpha reductase family enzyme